MKYFVLEEKLHRQLVEYTLRACLLPLFSHLRTKIRWNDAHQEKLVEFPVSRLCVIRICFRKELTVIVK